jgi:predicted nucleic acid-binding Zn ribbon protein
MQRAASLIRKLKLPAGSDSPEERAKAAWRLAGGPKIEKHTIAASLVRTTLIIEVGDITWQKQLHALRHALLRNIAEILGEPLVTDLDFRPMPPRRRPMREETAASGTGIADPVMSLLYNQSQKRQA